MNMLISACAADNGKSGIGHYIRATTAQLAANNGGNPCLTIYVDHGEHFLDDLATNNGRITIKMLPRLLSGTLGSLVWHLLFLPVITLLSKPQCVLFLAANRRLAFLPWCTTLGVVHDLSQLHIEGKYDRFRTFYVLTLLTALMRKLTRVVAVSHATASDLRSYVRIPPARISVVHNGADLSRFAAPAGREPPARYGIDSHYILYTARLEHPGKNHVRLLNAFCKLQNRCNLQLVLAGAPWNGAEKIYAEADRLGLGDRVVFTGFVASEDLPALVQNAHLFVFPSLFEGFGIPLLEAMAAGVPICSANRSSLPEVAGDAACLFDPEDPDDMARVMQKVLQSAELAADLVQRGRERAPTFTWERSANELLAECRRTCLLAETQRLAQPMT